MEEQSAKTFIGKEGATLTVLVEKGLALLIGKLASYPIQNSHESLIVNQSLLLQVDEFEGSVRTNSLILLNLSSLSDSLVNCDLKLKDSFVAYSIFEQAKTMDEQVHEKFLSFEGDACIHIFRELPELFMSEGVTIIGPVPQSIFNILFSLLCFFCETSDMGMFAAFKTGQKGGDCDSSILLELLEGMIDGSQSFLGDIIADIIDKLPVGYSRRCGEAILDSPDFLCGKKYAACIEEQIECMFGECTLVGGVVFGDLGVERDEVVVLLAEELEFEFVIDLSKRIYPVHMEVIIFIDRPFSYTLQAKDLSILTRRFAQTLLFIFS